MEKQLALIGFGNAARASAPDLSAVTRGYDRRTAGAFGKKHPNGLELIDGVQMISLVERRLEPTRAIAANYGIGHACTDLAETLDQRGLEAVIWCPPTQMHAAQAIQCLDAGKHVQVEIPRCSRLTDGEAVLAKSQANAVQGSIDPGARHRDGHVDPAEGGEWCDRHAVAQLQQRRDAEHVLSLHRRQRAVPPFSRPSNERECFAKLSTNGCGSRP